MDITESPLKTQPYPNICVIFENKIYLLLIEIPNIKGGNLGAVWSILCHASRAFSLPVMEALQDSLKSTRLKFKELKGNCLLSTGESCNTSFVD